MDISYSISKIGSNIILTDYTIPITSPYILAVLTLPTNCASSKTAIITGDQCNADWEINFRGVQESYEDLLAGLIYFNVAGTWSASLYYQSSDSNTDTANATYIDGINLQVI